METNDPKPKKSSPAAKPQQTTNDAQLLSDDAKRLKIIEQLQVMVKGLANPRNLEFEAPGVVEHWLEALMKFDLPVIKRGVKEIMLSETFFPSLAKFLETVLPIQVTTDQLKPVRAFLSPPGPTKLTEALKRSHAEIQDHHDGAKELLYSNGWGSTGEGDDAPRMQAIDVFPDKLEDACARIQAILACTAKFENDPRTNGLVPACVELYDWHPENRKANPDGKTYYRLRCWVHISNAEFTTRFKKLDTVGDKYHGFVPNEQRA